MSKPLLNENAQPIPFLKWPGGKRWLINKHPEWFPSVDGRHIEPFLGGAAVFFHRQPQKALLSDLNRHLIETYLAIREDPDSVFDLLKYHHVRHSNDYYYSMRDKKCRTATTKAAQFIYLNRTCFNGIYRVNLSGRFNVPIGSKTSVILPSDNFANIAKCLKYADLRTCGFVDTIRTSNRGDFLYLDPPYTVRHNTNNFVKYNEQIFSWSDQLLLAAEALLAAKRGTRVLISNANHMFVRQLYNDKVWVRLTVKRHSVLASSSERRKPTSELVVSNFLDSSGAFSDVRY